MKYGLDIDFDNESKEDENEDKEFNWVEFYE